MIHETGFIFLAVVVILIAVWIDGKNTKEE
jgi:hypothetical protein